MPWEVCVAIASALLGSIQFTTRFASNRHRNAWCSQSRKSLVAIPVRQQDPNDEGSALHLLRARAGLPRACSAQHGHFDDTALFGERESDTRIVQVAKALAGTLAAQLSSGEPTTFLVS